MRDLKMSISGGKETIISLAATFDDFDESLRFNVELVALCKKFLSTKEPETKPVTE